MSLPAFNACKLTWPLPDTPFIASEMCIRDSYRREEGRGSFLYGADLGDRIEKIWIPGERGYNRSQAEKRYAGIFGAMAGSA